MLPLTKTPRRRLGTVETEQISFKRLPGSEGCKDTMKLTTGPKKNFVRRDVVVCRTPRRIVYYYPKMPRVRHHIQRADPEKSECGSGLFIFFYVPTIDKADETLKTDYCCYVVP
ncbi:hypothetical protein KGM_200415 [Danaus plexippus plexippus]|uniref:Uncharacterized protein n=1 Tax=Danaus plexippus plexippus TaxID=278856 RepID=A0A212EV41_DANPL|nr:hypothetical protein KGM_200415 [Danaus plexippus plexippus]